MAGVYGYKEEVGTRLKVKAEMMGNTMEFWNPVGEIDMEGYAFFAQATWRPVPRVHLTAGLRYDHQELDGRVVNTNASMMKGALPDNQVFKDSLSYDEVLPKVALSVDLTDDMITYASVAKGYQIGGFNYSMVMSPDTNNAGEAHTYGAELEINARPMQGLDLFAGLGLTETEIDSWVDQTKTGRFNGDTASPIPIQQAAGHGVSVPDRPESIS